MSKETKFDLNKYIEEVCSDAGIKDTDEDTLHGLFDDKLKSYKAIAASFDEVSSGSKKTRSTREKDNVSFTLSYRDLLRIVITQNWDPALAQNSCKILLDRKLLSKFLGNCDISKALVPRQSLINYLQFVKKYFRHGMLISNVVEAELLFPQLEFITRSDMPILILGETGTGKELVANAIAENSLRKNKPFVAINCSGLSDELLYADVFGAARGSHSTAFEDRMGLISTAKDGILFLDEIGDSSERFQKAILRFINDGYYYKLGKDEKDFSNARIISATNAIHRAIRESVKNDFRADLYYRLGKHILYMRPLRYSRTNIPLIFYLYSKLIRKGLGYKEPIKISLKEMLYFLDAEHLDGNYRELINFIESYALSYISMRMLTQDKYFNITNITQSVYNDIFADFPKMKKNPILVYKKASKNSRELVVPGNDEYELKSSQMAFKHDRLFAEITNLESIVNVPHIILLLLKYDIRNNEIEFNLEQHLKYSTIYFDLQLGELYLHYEEEKHEEPRLARQGENKSRGDGSIFKTLVEQELSIDELKKKYLSAYLNAKTSPSLKELKLLLGKSDKRTIYRNLIGMGCKWPKNLKKPKI